jgi:hypothetical protein
VSQRLRLALAVLLLATLAYGIAVGAGAGAPDGYAAADCFHVDADGAVRDCADAAAHAGAPTGAEQAANWAWWGAAAFPVALAAAVFAALGHLRRRLPRRPRSAA